MSVFDLFSKRQKRLRGEVPDVYVYDNIPDPLRVQIVHIWQDALGNAEQYHRSYNGVSQAYEYIVAALCREYGTFLLTDRGSHRNRNYLQELADFILETPESEKILDAVELSFRLIDRGTRSTDYLSRHNASAIADKAIEELNARMKEHGVGYQFVNGDIIRIDSELVHAEVVKPALSLLRAKRFAGAEEEFLKAHQHYRHGDHKEALAECLKVFESVMKIICDKRKWKYDPTATSKTLIQTCLDNGLIPPFWQSYFTSLKSVLESGVPTVRNKLGGHGQGSGVIEVPGHIVAYALHMTASTIVFLAEADQALK